MCTSLDTVLANTALGESLSGRLNAVIVFTSSGRKVFIKPQCIRAKSNSNASVTVK